MTQFHIGIRNGKELRRSLLESLKSVVMTLQQYDDFLKLRREREAEVMKLRKLMREISLLNAKLSNEMPRSKAVRPGSAKGMPGSKGKGDVVTTEGAKRLSKISQLTRLGKRIAAIEDELRKMR